MGQTYLLVLKDILWKQGAAVAQCEDKDPDGVVLGNTYWCEPPGGCHFLTKTWLHPTAYWLQSSDTSYQRPKMAGTQPHLSAERLLKGFLSIALPTRGTRHSSIHQSAGTCPSHQEACQSLLYALIQQVADNRSRKNYNPAAWGTKSAITES